MDSMDDDQSNSKDSKLDDVQFIDDPYDYEEEEESGPHHKLRSTTKQLRMLSFKNPGRFMDNFDPERSTREMRKVNRRIYRETVRKNQIYDDRGRLLSNSQDVCDCLEQGCPGCHLPCPKCGSERCGAECRCNRRWYYCELEVEGSDTKLTMELQTTST